MHSPPCQFTEQTEVTFQLLRFLDLEGEKYNMDV